MARTVVPATPTGFPRRGVRSGFGVPLGALDGVPGDVPDLAVAGLGLAGEQVEGLVGGDVVVPDEDALRLVDDRPGFQGALQGGGQGGGAGGDAGGGHGDGGGAGGGGGPLPGGPVGRGGLG